MADSASASRSDGARASRERVARAKREAEERGLLTLSTILRIMEPAPLTVELNDDTVIVGMLDESDAYMNITLNGAERRSADGSSAALEKVYIKGTAIRCVHLPAGMDCEKMMQDKMRSIEQGARSFSQRTQKAPTERPANLAPIVGSVISEADADVE